MLRNIRRADVDAVGAAVDVAHHEQTLVRIHSLLCIRIEGSTDRFMGEALRRFDGRGPVAVVPPALKSQAQNVGQVIKAELHFIRIDGETFLACPIVPGRLRMVVEHDVDAHVVCLLEEAFHIREQIGVDLIAGAAGSDALAPVGIDNEVIQRDLIGLMVIPDLLQSLFLGVCIIAAVPCAKGRKRKHLGLAGQLVKVLAELYAVALRQEDVHIRGVVVCIKAVCIHILRVFRRLRCEAPLRHGHTRGIAHLPGIHFLAWIGQIDLAARHALIFPQEVALFVGNGDAGDVLRIRGNSDVKRAGAQDDAAVRIFAGNSRPFPIVTVGNMEGFAVLKPFRPLFFQTHNRRGQDLNAHVADDF